MSSALAAKATTFLPSAFWQAVLRLKKKRSHCLFFIGDGKENLLAIQLLEIIAWHRRQGCTTPNNTPEGNCIYFIGIHRLESMPQPPIRTPTTAPDERRTQSRKATDKKH